VFFDENPFKSYQFLTDIQDLERGEEVVVDTRNGLKVATVEGYGERNHSIPMNIMKWVVQRIDLDAHKLRLEKEARREELRLKLEERRKEIEEIQIYELLAKEDPSMKEILDEFKGI